MKDPKPSEFKRIELFHLALGQDLQGNLVLFLKEFILGNWNQVEFLYFWNQSHKNGKFYREIKTSYILSLANLVSSHALRKLFAFKILPSVFWNFHIIKIMKILECLVHLYSV